MIAEPRGNQNHQENLRPVAEHRSVAKWLILVGTVGWVLFVNVVFYLQLWKQYGAEIRTLVQHLIGE